MKKTPISPKNRIKRGGHVERRQSSLLESIDEFEDITNPKKLLLEFFDIKEENVLQRRGEPIEIDNPGLEFELAYITQNLDEDQENEG